MDDLSNFRCRSMVVGITRFGVNFTRDQRGNPESSLAAESQLETIPQKMSRTVLAIDKPHSPTSRFECDNAAI
jgi:hypothetical protein